MTRHFEYPLRGRASRPRRADLRPRRVFATDGTDCHGYEPHSFDPRPAAISGAEKITSGRQVWRPELMPATTGPRTGSTDSRTGFPGVQLYCLDLRTGASGLQTGASDLQLRGSDLQSGDWFSQTGSSDL